MEKDNMQTIAPDVLFSAIGEELAVGRNASFTVTGMSMWPFICNRRDQVIVSACDPSSLCIGDIILFQTPFGNYMLHRITALRPDAFETTGDGNCFRDGWFSRDCVKARVKTVLRKGKAHECSAFSWRCMSTIWRILFPVRRPLLRMLRFIGYCKAKIRKGISGSNAAKE